MDYLDNGYLAYTTRIMMFDGSIKLLGKVKVGDSVLGMDEHGKIVETTITSILNDGVGTRKWLSVQGPRLGVTKGNSYWSVNCTPQQLFWNPVSQQYVQAEDLRESDTVTMVRSDLKLTPIQEQVLIGKMLGDGYLHCINYSASVAWGHTHVQEAYTDWTLQAIGDIASETKQYRTSGYGTKMIGARTISHYSIKELFQDWYVNDGKKGIPAWLEHKLTPIAMAFWYMDDGSLSHQKDQEDRANFAVCGFTKEDCDVLLAAFAKFGIQGTYYQARGSRIRLNADEAEKFFLLIAPYVPPTMQYKLPERYRGHQGWIPKNTNTYKTRLVHQRIDTVKASSNIKSALYSMETETHNFFANHVLVRTPMPSTTLWRNY